MQSGQGHARLPSSIRQSVYLSCLVPPTESTNSRPLHQGNFLVHSINPSIRCKFMMELANIKTRLTRCLHDYLHHYRWPDFYCYYHCHCICLCYYQTQVRLKGLLVSIRLCRYSSELLTLLLKLRIVNL